MNDVPRTETHPPAGIADRSPNRRALAGLLAIASAAVFAVACSSENDVTDPPEVPLSEVEGVQPPAGNTIPTFVAPESATPPDPADAVPAPGVIVEQTPWSPAPTGSAMPDGSDT